MCGRLSIILLKTFYHNQPRLAAQFSLKYPIKIAQ